MAKPHDSKFYFSDGSIVLSAPSDDTESVVYFRVHASLLARESTVFRDMFSIPTPPSRYASKNDTYDGVPLVAMHDKAEHLRGFLMAIYEPHMVFLRPFSDDTPNVLTGPLLLSKKYEANTLQARIIAHLTFDWTAKDHQQWRARKEGIERHYYSETGPPCPEHLLHLSWVTKTRDDLEIPLSMAYYALSCKKIEEYRSELLTTEDLLIVARGRRDMEAFYKDSIMHGTGKLALSSYCGRCNVGTYKDGLLMGMVKSKMTDILVFFEEMMPSVLSCNAEVCKGSRFAWHHELTTQAFMKIPEFFVVRRGVE